MSESRLSRSYRLALAMLPRPFRERHRAEIERHFETLLADQADFHGGVECITQDAASTPGVSTRALAGWAPARPMDHN